MASLNDNHLHGDALLELKTGEDGKLRLKIHGRYDARGPRPILPENSKFDLQNADVRMKNGGVEYDLVAYVLFPEPEPAELAPVAGSGESG